MASTDPNLSRDLHTNSEYNVPEFLEVTVTDPETITTPDSAPYTLYTVTITTNIPSYADREGSVKRRYSDFYWLHQHLCKIIEEHNARALKPVRLIDELPSDTVTSMYGDLVSSVKRMFGSAQVDQTPTVGRFEPEFIERRRLALEKFLRDVTVHPLCSKDHGLSRFLKEKHMKPIIDYYSL
eukprot:TRINITY_DN2344_c0_g2_i1.p1 TRINITY_DN2344_c0_g2~~TRINITY_DN2344_c0_g2_i1.p1  ORF type:complete len:199 (+),score=33.39 TRINITY_DN2344_c0_g2_i1:52-597(+)